MRAPFMLCLLCSCVVSCFPAENVEPYAEEIDSLKAADEKNFKPRLHTLLLKVLTPDIKQDIWLMNVAEFLQKNPDRTYKDALENLVPFPVRHKPTPYSKAEGALERAWVAVATSGLDEDEKANALAAAFAPGFHARVQNAAIKAIKQLKNGREILYNHILKWEEHPIKPSDILIIGELYGGVCEDALFFPTEDEFRKMINSNVTFQKIFACRCLARKGDERAKALMLNLIKQDQFRKNGMRGAQIIELSYLPNKIDCFVEIANVVIGEPKTSEAGQFLMKLVGRLGSVDKNATNVFAARTMLQKISELELKIPDQSKNPDDFMMLYYYVEAKAAARELLEGL